MNKDVVPFFLTIVSPILIAAVLIPFWLGSSFSTAPYNTQGLLEITSALQLRHSAGRIESTEVTLPDSWRLTANDANKVRYEVLLNHNNISSEIPGQIGLLIPSYRHKIQVWLNGRFLGSAGSKNVGLPKRAMPILRVPLTLIDRPAQNKLEIEVLSDWPTEGGLGRLWIGSYDELENRQSSLVKNRMAILWLAAGTLLSLILYQGAYAFMMRGRSWAFCLSIPHFLMILHSVLPPSFGEPLYSFKINTTLVTLVVFSWGQQLINLLDNTPGKANWVALPVAIGVVGFWMQPTFEMALQWHVNAMSPLWLLMGTTYFVTWLRASHKADIPLVVKVLVTYFVAILASAGYSDIYTVRSFDAVEHELRFRYFASFVAPFLFLGMAINTARAEVTLTARKAELDRLVDLQTGKLLHVQSQLRLNERYKIMYTMASGISHEIKNPLATISATLKLLKTSNRNPEKNMQPLVARMERNVERIDQTIILLNNHTRRETVHLLPGDLATWLEQMLAEEQTSGLLSELECTLDIQAVGDVFFDAEKMRRVIVNLIQNACRACSSVEHKKIRVKLRATDNQAVLSIEDNGSGLNTAIAARVHEPLVSGNQLGMGLGLAYVSDIMKKHGGSFRLENNQNTSGAVATVYMQIDNSVE